MKVVGLLGFRCNQEVNIFRGLRNPAMLDPESGAFQMHFQLLAG